MDQPLLSNTFTVLREPDLPFGWQISSVWRQCSWTTSSLFSTSNLAYANILYLVIFLPQIEFIISLLNYVWLSGFGISYTPQHRPLHPLYQDSSKCNVIYRHFLCSSAGDSIRMCCQLNSEDGFWHIVNRLLL